MNNKNVFIVGAVVLVLAIGGYIIFGNASNKTTSKVQDVNNKMSMNDQLKNVGGKMSLQSLMGMGQNQACTFEDVQSGSSGVVYVSSGKVRGDFSYDDNGNLMSSHMINNGKDMYVWTDDGQEGYKMSVESVTNMNISGMPGPTEAMVDRNSPENMLDVNKQIDYSCTNWGVDASKFTPPSNIKFNDYSEMMNDTMKMMEESSSELTEAPQVDCSMCNSVPAEAQEQCRAALKCN